MTEIKLGYSPKKKYKWIELPMSYEGKFHNEKMVVTVHVRLWEKIRNIMYIRSRGYDILPLVDGKRRTGKSTVAKTMAYLLNPNITIDNFVIGLEDSLTKIDKAKDEDVLLFDEASLVANSKDQMKQKNVQLGKIIDVVGQKRLCLIFILPSFFGLARDIAINHSKFLIHVYTDEKLNRGRFAYFGEKKKKMLYEIGKKNFGSYSKPHSDWLGTFRDFVLPFEDEYLALKRKALQEALHPELAKKKKPLTESDYKTTFMLNFKEHCPEITDQIISKGFGVSKREYYRRKRARMGVKSD